MRTEPSVEALCLEGGGRGFAQRRVARAEQDAGAGPADLSGDLEADAFVGAGDQRDARGCVVQTGLLTFGWRGRAAVD